MTVTAKVASRALHSGSMPLGFSVGGQYLTVSGSEVHYDGADLVYHTLGTQTFTVSAPAGQTTSIPVQANWQFNGNYGDTSVPVLECGGYINITRQ